MASTNKTSGYSLSQFIGSDIPSWLGDYNGDMLKIDTALKSINATATQGNSTAISAKSAAAAAQQTANSALVKAQTNTSSITSLKQNLNNTTVVGTPIPLGANSNVVVSYSDYIIAVRLYCVFDQKPTNTTVVGSNTRFPLFSVPNNVFDLKAGTIADDSGDIVGLGYVSFFYTTSSDQKYTAVYVLAYYDGANTVFFTSVPTAIVSEINNINVIFGNLVALPSGVLVDNLRLM